MPVDLSQASLPFAVGVSFNWDTTNWAHYVRLEEDITVESIDYVAETRLMVRHEPQDGGVKDTPWTVELVRGLSPLEDMLFYPHAPVETWIYDIDPSNLTRTLRFAGFIIRTKAYSKGRSDIIEAEVAGRRSHLAETSLGLVAEDYCPWSLFDGNCKKSDSGFTDTATITAINDEKITMSGLANSGTANYYTFGWVEFQGLRLGIRKHSSTDLHLYQAPPPGWDGQDVLCVAGCDKTKDTCISKFNNAEHFMGCGLKMPKHHPLIEDRP